MNYYISDAGEQRGPYTRNQLTRMWDSGAVTAEALYSAEGMTEWRRLEELVGTAAEEPPKAEFEPLAARVGRALGKSWGSTKVIVGSVKDLFKQEEPAPATTAEGHAAVASPSGEPHTTSAAEPPSEAAPEPAHRDRMVVGIAVAAMLLGLLLVVAIAPGASTKSSSSQSTAGTAETATTVVDAVPRPPRNRYPEELQASLTAHVTERLKANKQRLFDGFHPTGRATDVKVNEVKVRWKDGALRRQWEDVESYAVRFVLYWQGPITTDGYSEIELLYDAAIDRIVSQRVLRTNGITRDDLSSAAGELAADLLRQWSENR